MEKLLIVDEESGEVRGRYKHKARKKNHEYVLVFYKNLFKYKVTQLELLLLLVAEIDKDNKLIVTKSLRKRISSLLSVKEKTVRNAVTELVKNNIFIRINYSIYFVNPFLFSKTNLYHLNQLRIKFKNLLIKKLEEDLKKAIKAKKDQDFLNYVKGLLNDE